MLQNKRSKQALLNRPDLAAGDNVIVVAGKDKGKRGRVLRTLPSQGKIVVEGVNILKRHTKAGQSRGGTRAMQGGIVDYEAPLAYSNVMLVCPSCDRPTRIRHVEIGEGRKALKCVNCGEIYERLKQVEQQ
jgi:large subunit ribosomal protein L24